MGRQKEKVGRGEGVRSVRRAFDILTCIAAHQHDPVRLAAIATETALHKASVSRLLATLEEIGAVEREGHRYVIGPALAALTLGSAPAQHLQDAARLSLVHLADRFGDTFSLSVRSGLDAVCLDRQQGWYPIQAFAHEVGGRRPLGIGAGSVALFAWQPDDEVTAIIAATARRLERYPEVTSARLEGFVRTTKRQGYALVQELVVPGMSGLGVPVRDSRGVVVGAISLATVSERLDGVRIGELVEAMLKEAAAVRARLASAARAPGGRLALRYPAEGDPASGELRPAGA